MKPNRATLRNPSHVNRKITLRAVPIADSNIFSLPYDYDLGVAYIVSGIHNRVLQVARDPVEIRMKNAMARTLLETYVGPHASAEILARALRLDGFTTDVDQRPSE
jgi:hypothetical protein